VPDLPFAVASADPNVHSTTTAKAERADSEVDGITSNLKNAEKNQGDTPDRSAILRAHRVVLAARSAFFSGMFTGKFQETQERKLLLVPSFSSVPLTKDAVRSVLEFLYTGVAPSIGDIAGNARQKPRIMAAVAEQETQEDHSNVYAVLDLAHCYMLGEL